MKEIKKLWNFGVNSFSNLRTGKPEHKRDHIKSQAMSQCRPLPFSSQVQTINQYPSVPSEYMNIHPQIDSDGSISSENR